MSSSRERQAWTEYVEMRQRQRNQTAKRRRKSETGTVPSPDLEAALDDLTQSTGRRPPDKDA
jgi:hypothetical protein